MNIERIFHIDVNSAFRSWEAVYRLAHKDGRLDVREAASAVGGDISMRHELFSPNLFRQKIRDSGRRNYSGSSEKMKGLNTGTSELQGV